MSGKNSNLEGQIIENTTNTRELKTKTTTPLEKSKGAVHDQRDL